MRQLSKRIIQTLLDSIQYRQQHIKIQQQQDRDALRKKRDNVGIISKPTCLCIQYTIQIQYKKEVLTSILGKIRKNTEN